MLGVTQASASCGDTGLLAILPLAAVLAVAFTVASPRTLAGVELT